MSIADRLDSLVGLIAMGCAPTGGADPLGLRRTAYGLLETLVANQQRLDLTAAVREAASLLPCEASQSCQVQNLHPRHKASFSRLRQSCDPSDPPAMYALAMSCFSTAQMPSLGLSIIVAPGQQFVWGLSAHRPLLDHAVEPADLDLRC